MSKSLAIIFLSVIGTALSGQAQNKAGWLTALYLRPVEFNAADQANWPLLPAQLLEAAPTDSILTPKGSRIVRRLRRGDVLYRYEPATGRQSTWEIRIVQRKARQVDALYSSVQGEDLSLPENRVSLDKR